MGMKSSKELWGRMTARHIFFFISDSRFTVESTSTSTSTKVISIGQLSNFISLQLMPKQPNRLRMQLTHIVSTNNNTNGMTNKYVTKINTNLLCRSRQIYCIVARSIYETTSAMAERERERGGRRENVRLGECEQRLVKWKFVSIPKQRVWVSGKTYENKVSADRVNEY